MQQQQPLAFTLVKTIVTARDEGRRLSFPLATAWQLIRAELSPAHRVMADEVKWGPAYQSDLKFVIEGVKDQFARDPALEQEIISFIAQVEPFAKEESPAALPLVMISSAEGGTTLSVLEEAELSSPPGTNVEDISASNLMVNQSSSDGSATEQSGNAVEPQLRDDGGRVSHRANETNLPPTKRTTANSSGGSVSAFPLIGGLLFVAAMLTATFYIWPAETSDPITEDEIASPNLVPSTLQQDTSSEEGPGFENSMGNTFEDRTRIPYPTAALGAEIDSLLGLGEYADALARQKILVQEFEREGSVAAELDARAALASLYAATQDPNQAVLEQRKVVELSYEVIGENALQTGRAHLALALYYAETKEDYMSSAHLRQAKKIFGQHQALVVPSDIKASNLLSDQLKKRS